MPNPIIRFGFSAGVLSPELIFRSDLTKFDLALREANNFFIDYQGGAAVRPGTEFIDYMQDDDEPGRIFNFTLDRSIAANYAILFHKNRIRFLQNGAYVLEAAKTINTLSTTITANGHGYANNDWVKILGETYEVYNVTINTFQVRDTLGVAQDLTGSGAAEVQRIYTLASPYATADLPDLDISQDKSSLYITHKLYYPRVLTRTSNTVWSLDLLTIEGNEAGIATVASVTSSSAGSSAILVAVTTVDDEGQESPLGAASLELLTSAVNNSVTAGEYRIEVTPVTNAAKYRFYRSRIVTNGQENYGLELGYIGESISPFLVDTNITPDYTRTPITRYDPFLPGAVTDIEITAGGSGYDNTTTVSVTGAGGADFEGVPIVHNGAVIAVRILNTGSYYPTGTTTVSFTGPGTGATATAVVAPQSQIFPATNIKSQQRRIYGATVREPATVFGSRLGFQTSFDDSGFGLPDDPYILEIEQDDATEIKYLRKFPDGYFVFSSSGVNMVRGVDDAAVSGATAKNRPQSSIGARKVPPLMVDQEILYISDSATEIVVLRQSNLPTYYSTFQASDLASHYFKTSNPIVSWTWAKAPHRLIWAVRADGSLLSMTYVPKQELYAWTDHKTDGFFEDIESVFEDPGDVTYAIVRRTINGNSRRYIERISPAIYPTVEDMWASDCALQTLPKTPAANIFFQPGPSNTIQIVADAGVFSSFDLGKIFRARNGKGRIVEFNSATVLTVEFDVPMEVVTGTIYDIESLAQGEWELWTYNSSVEGLKHLEGETVDILADGRVFAQQTVVDGAITLEVPATKIIVGLPYEARIVTLPPSVPDNVIEHLEKNVTSLAIRFHKARGLKVGADPALYERDAASLWDGLAVDFTTGLQEIEIADDFTYDTPITLKKDSPVWSKVLGLVMELNIGQG